MNMRIWAVGLLVEVGVFGCFAYGLDVVERVPAVERLAPSDPDAVYVQGVAHEALPEDHDIDHLESPDGKMRIEFTSDVYAISRTPTGFHGAELVDTAGRRRRPVLSFWESDPGSGYSITVHWSKDSHSVRFRGTSLGYARTQQSYVKFDLLYLVARDRFVDLSSVPLT